MNCFNHPDRAAVGFCAVCHKAICRQCVARSSPRIVCVDCLGQGVIYGFEYRSAMTVGSWPLIHLCFGTDPATLRPKVAKGVIAIGNIAVGGVAIGGLACGLLTFSGVSFGLLGAFGGVAIGLGLSMGGVAFGSIAVAGVAVGLKAAMGGVALGPAVIDARHCDQAALDLFRAWFGNAIPRSCR